MSPRACGDICFQACDPLLLLARLPFRSVLVTASGWICCSVVCVSRVSVSAVSVTGSLTYSQVPCGSLQCAADFSCEATDPQLGLLWIEGLTKNQTKGSSSSSRQMGSEGGDREDEGSKEVRCVLHVGVREKAQRLRSQVLTVGRTVDALCPIEAAGVVALACPAEMVVRVALLYAEL